MSKCKWWNPFTWGSKGAPSEADATKGQTTRVGRRIVRSMGLAETVIKPWKKAIDARDGTIRSLVEERRGLRDRLQEYVTALKERDEIILRVAEERDDLTAKLEAIENGEKPADSPEVPEPEALPPSPGIASNP